MQDQYRKSIKKTTSGQAAKKVKKYKFDDQLQFLEPRIQERDTLSNIEDVVDNEDVDIFNENMGKNKNENENAEIQSDEHMNEIVSDGGKQLQTVKQTMDSKSIKKWTKNHLNYSPYYMTSPLMKYITHKQDHNMANATQSNPVDAFLTGLSPTLKTFTPYYLNLVKSKIFSVVQEHEKKMILDEEQKKKSHTAPNFTVSSPTYQ
ncbi:uncharacterized protein LOC132918206 isoform X2 [Rhopalosiphum padi]|nr:uncharacterized protein LOC132918206 isoform X2 [Rhopalosiphum padi]